MRISTIIRTLAIWLGAASIVLCAVPVSAASGSWQGAVSGVNGSTLTFYVSGMTYTVYNNGASLLMADGSLLNFSYIETNDSLTVAGTMNGNTIAAQSIVDNSMQRYVHVDGTVVSVVSGTSFTVQAADKGTVTANMANGASVNINGIASPVGSLSYGQSISAVGTYDQANKALWTTDVRVGGNYNGNSYSTTNTGNGSVSLSLSPNSTTLINGQTTTVTATLGSDGLSNVNIVVNGGSAQNCPVTNFAASSVCTFSLYGGNYS